MKELKMWKRSIKRDIVYMFPMFGKCRPNSERESNKKHFIHHLGALQKVFVLF